MARNWLLTRTEAEFLVDQIEDNGKHLYLADELREIWGMKPRDPPPVTPDSDREKWWTDTYPIKDDT